MKKVFGFHRLLAFGLGMAGLSLPASSGHAAEGWTLDTARAAAAKGDAGAEYFLGRSYLHGVAVTRDDTKAAEYFREAATGGYAPAQSGLGSCYAHGLGVKADLTEAIKWYRDAAAQGEPLAEYCMGYACAYGQGMPKDIDQAIIWWQESASQGQVYAQNALGQLYFYGESRGDTKHVNHPEAAKWLLKAAEQNYPPAMITLAQIYQDGNGLPADHQQALKWYQRAAEAGDAAAQDQMGLLYQDGHDGLARDRVQAYKWFSLSAAQGNAEGRHDKLEYDLNNALTPEESARAQRMIAEYHPTTNANQAAADR